jgi:hypothetical protein
VAEDLLRIITHPSFSQTEGVGIYTYPQNPHNTLNFHTAPLKRIDSVVHKTIGGSVIVKRAEENHDVVISEIWRGEDGSMLAAQFLKFWDFLQTEPPIGEYLTWAPRDLTTEVYSIELLDIGGPDFDFNELRVDTTTRTGAYLRDTVVLKFKIARTITLPTGVITLAGR